MTTILYRGNDKGEILDADGKVIGRVVPPEPSDEQCAKAVCIARVWPDADLVNVPKEFVDVVRGYHKAMLSAATLDLSAAAVRVPERRTQSEDERYHPDAHYECGLTDGWNDCLDALGVRP